jgi:hypothetical protein
MCSWVRQATRAPAGWRYNVPGLVIAPRSHCLPCLQQWPLTAELHSSPACMHAKKFMHPDSSQHYQEVLKTGILLNFRDIVVQSCHREIHCRKMQTFRLVIVLSAVARRRVNSSCSSRSSASVVLEGAFALSNCCRRVSFSFCRAPFMTVKVASFPSSCFVLHSESQE